MADDAGALLVRSGLVSTTALDEARARVENLGGTLGEQLVTSGAITDDDLTEFYRARLLVPQVNPNTLARLTPKVVGSIPSDMAIELRAIPVALDADNNLTIAMSDPSDRHAVDEIAFFTGLYIVRAVATQMQIAWCLAHYYGHITALGQRLLHAAESPRPQQTPRPQRAKGVTAKVNAARHRAIAPITRPVDVARPNGTALDRRSEPRAAGTPDTLDAAAAIDLGAHTPVDLSVTPIDVGAGPVVMSIPHAAGRPPVTAPRLPSNGRASAPHQVPVNAGVPKPVSQSPSAPNTAPLPPSTRAPARPATAPASTPVPFVPRAAPDAKTISPDDDEPGGLPAPDFFTEDEPGADEPSNGTPDQPRARSVSGEIRAPGRRAPSIRPPMPAPHDDDDDDEPQIVIERAPAPAPRPVAAKAGPGDDDATAVRRTPLPRRRAVKSDPPELYARAGEVDLKTGADRAVDDEPRIVIDEDALSPPTSRIVRPASLAEASVVHDRMADYESAPILLDKPRSTPSPFRAAVAAAAEAMASEVDAAPRRAPSENDDTKEIIVVLDKKSEPTPRPPIVAAGTPNGGRTSNKHTTARPERRTQVGIPPAPSTARPHRDTEATGVPMMVAHIGPEQLSDPTVIDLKAAPAGDDTSSDTLAAPPSPDRDDDTNPHVVAAPPAPTRSGRQAAMIVEDDDDDDDEDRDEDDDEDLDDLEADTGERRRARHTQEMSAVELDDAVPARSATPDLVRPAKIDYDPVDDGWGPPGTTIPPPLLGAIPGSEDDDGPQHVIPMPSIDSSPLLVGPTSPPNSRNLARALDDAAGRALEVIRRLEHAQSRDEVVEILIAHLAETHHRAGFFVTKHGVAKNTTELSLFAMRPQPAVMPFATLRLDRPSTLQDVVGTRLPYRGPMHDDASRSFMISNLGACPAEILLVPVAVRERVVGVVFGEHRQRHTFDDQVALAARAAGQALERILKSRRS